MNMRNEQEKSQMEIKKELWNLLFSNPAKLREIFTGTPDLITQHGSIYNALEMLESKNDMPEMSENSEIENDKRITWEDAMRKIIEEKLSNENKNEDPLK